MLSKEREKERMRKRDRQGKATQSRCRERRRRNAKALTSPVPRVTPENEQRERSDDARTKEEYQRKKGAMGGREN